MDVSLNLVKEVLTMSSLLKPILQYNKDIQAEQHFYGSDKRQYFLYFPPETDISNEKIIVYIHGGGWCKCTANNFKYIGAWFSKKGYHTISIGYRHSPKNKYPSQGEDVFCGLQKAIVLLASRGVKADNIVLVGSSAGGHLCGVLAYDRRLQQKYEIPPSSLKGFVSLGGVLRFDTEYTKSTMKLFDKLFERHYDVRFAEPYSLLTGKETVRTLCLHSKSDPIISFKNVVDFHRKMERINSGQCELFVADEKKYFHSNLVAGIFFDDDPISSEPLNTMYDWICNL